VVFKALSGAPPAELCHALRWFNHINSYGSEKNRQVQEESHVTLYFQTVNYLMYMLSVETNSQIDLTTTLHQQNDSLLKTLRAFFHCQGKGPMPYNFGENGVIFSLMGNEKT
jgi:hypothetical protein